MMFFFIIRAGAFYIGHDNMVLYKGLSYDLLNYIGFICHSQNDKLSLHGFHLMFFYVYMQCMYTIKIKLGFKTNSYDIL